MSHKPPLYRVLWQVNRSPLRYTVKRSLRLIQGGKLRQRVALAQSLPQQAESLEYADCLLRDGYVVLTSSVDTALLTALAEAAEKKQKVADRAAMHPSERHKTFWTQLLDEDMTDGKLPVSSPYVQFAIQPAIIRILARAFGEIPRLEYTLLMLSHFSEADSSYSQLWHRDHDDVRTIKLFVYLSDVADECDGPFTFLPAQLSDHYGYTLKSHREDHEIFGNGPAKASDVKAMIAPALSVFMVETSRCLHMGSRLFPGHSRLLYTALYTAVPCMFPGRRNRFWADVPLKSSTEQALLDL